MKLLLSVKETAEAMGTHKNNVYELIRRGELAAVKVGTTKVPVAEIKRWIEKETSKE